MPYLRHVFSSGNPSREWLDVSNDRILKKNATHSFAIEFDGADLLECDWVWKNRAQAGRCSTAGGDGCTA